MRTFALSLTIVIPFTLLTAEGACAANPTWATGYPKAGSAAGKIAVKGSINVGAPDKTIGAATIFAWPKDGGAVSTHNFTLPSQSGVTDWGEAEISGLTSGQDYNVFVQIGVLTPQGTTYYLNTSVGVVRAP